jgi:pimeloyl-ACP methyl ester carboxylesterase
LEEEADSLYNLLQQLHITKAILFGHSDGGSIALIAAAKYPLVIQTVIAEAAHIFVEPETLAGIEAAVKAYQETDLKNRLAKYHGEKTDTVFRIWTETWLSDTYQSWNIEHFLPKIICPTLIIQGEKDEYGTIKQVEGIVHATTGKCIAIILPGLSHTPHKEAPEIVLQHAINFIKANNL